MPKSDSNFQATDFMTDLLGGVCRVNVEIIAKRPISLWKSAFNLLGSPGRIRTSDRVVNSHLLYRLSYRGPDKLFQVLESKRLLGFLFYMGRAETHQITM
jgi:hypothetical protein